MGARQARNSDLDSRREEAKGGIHWIIEAVRGYC
jgi:hypothetical protein